MSDITRALFNTLLPPGVLWVPKEDGDFDLLLDGMSDNWETVRDFLESLAYLRDPQKTEILSDLEKEYGVLSNTSLTIQERRDRLTVQKNDRISDGTDDFLQKRLRDSGFDVYVYQNDPPVDPNTIAIHLFQIYAGGSNAYAGRPDAYAAKTTYDVIINGFIDFPYYSILTGPYLAHSGGYNAYSGRPDAYAQNILYVLDDPNYWHLIFFIGGAVTRDPITDEILTLEAAIIPDTRRQEFIKLVMKYKPMHSWGATKVLFTT